MAEFTKEQLIAHTKKEIREWNSDLDVFDKDDEQALMEVAVYEIALAALAASMEQEPVASIDRANLDYLESGADADVWPAFRAGSDDVLLYAAPQLPQPAVPDADDNFYSWFCREWEQYYQPNQYSTSAKQHLGAIAESAWFACRAAMLNRQCVDHVDGMLPTTIKPVADLYEVTVPSGRSTTFTKDAAEAKDCTDMGWKVQEYVTLERYQAVMLQGAEPDFREISNSSTKHFRENAETSTRCPKCSGRGSYHCPQVLGTVECECTLPAEPQHE